MLNGVWYVFNDIQFLIYGVLEVRRNMCISVEEWWGRAAVVQLWRQLDYLSVGSQRVTGDLDLSNRLVGLILVVNSIFNTLLCGIKNFILNTFFKLVPCIPKDFANKVSIVFSTVCHRL